MKQFTVSRKLIVGAITGWLALVAAGAALGAWMAYGLQEKQNTPAQESGADAG